MAVIAYRPSPTTDLPMAAGAGAEADIEAAKRRASVCAVDQHIVGVRTGAAASRPRRAVRDRRRRRQDGLVVGIGSGSTIVHAVNRLGARRGRGGEQRMRPAASPTGPCAAAAERVRSERLRIVCIPSSFQAQQLLVEAELPTSSLTVHPRIHVAIDGADEVDMHLNCIKGGGGCQLQEKLVAFNADKFVVVADYRKYSRVLGEQWRRGLPVEVVPMAFRPVMAQLESVGRALGLAPCKAVLRVSGGKAGPVVTDNGNFIIDVDYGLIAHPAELNTRLLALPGVVETGLFVGMVHQAYFGMADGSVLLRTRGDRAGHGGSATATDPGAA